MTCTCRSRHGAPQSTRSVRTFSVLTLRRASRRRVCVPRASLMCPRRFADRSGNHGDHGASTLVSPVLGPGRDERTHDQSTYHPWNRRAPSRTCEAPHVPSGSSNCPRNFTICGPFSTPRYRTTAVPIVPGVVPGTSPPRHRKTREDSEQSWTLQRNSRWSAGGMAGAKHSLPPLVRLPGRRIIEDRTFRPNRTIRSVVGVRSPRWHSGFRRTGGSQPLPPRTTTRPKKTKPSGGPGRRRRIRFSG
jgi:hypothetical protein